MIIALPIEVVSRRQFMGWFVSRPAPAAALNHLSMGEQRCVAAGGELSFPPGSAAEAHPALEAANSGQKTNSQACSIH